MLTQACLRALREMIDAEERGDHDAAEIVGERGSWWLAHRQVSVGTVSRLMRMTAVRESADGGLLSRLTPNSVGRFMARNPGSSAAISEALLSGEAFMIESDRIVFLSDMTPDDDPEAVALTPSPG